MIIIVLVIVLLIISVHQHNRVWLPPIVSAGEILIAVLLRAHLFAIYFCLLLLTT